MDRERKVPVLLGADVVLAGSHERTAHRAARPPGRHHDGGVRADLQRLMPGHAHVERRVRVGLLLLEIVRGDDDTVGGDVEPELHTTDPELAARLVIELDWEGRLINQGLSLRKLFQHLLDREPKRLQLLLLHPENMRLTRHRGQQPESPVARLAERIDPDSLGIATGCWCQKIVSHGVSSLVVRKRRMTRIMHPICAESQIP